MKYILLLSILLLISIALNIIVLVNNEFRVYILNNFKGHKIITGDYKQTKKQEYTHSVLKNMLVKFLKIAEKHDIKYWATAGTLLGVIRHRNIIPWDDDIDLGITPDSLEKIKKIDKDGEFLKEGILIDYDNITQLRFKENNIHIDLFEYKLTNNKYKMTNDWCAKSFPKEFYFKEEIETLEVNNLDDIPIKIPSNHKRFLDHTYDNWKEMVSWGEHGDTNIKKKDYIDFKNHV